MIFALRIQRGIKKFPDKPIKILLDCLTVMQQTHFCFSQLHKNNKLQSSIITFTSTLANIKISFI